LLTQIDAIYGAEVNAPAWSNTASYFAWQQVTHNGITWEALRANTNVEPGAVGSSADWQPSEKALALPILGVTTTDSLLIRKVTGLNPPDIDLFIGEYARDGGTYQGRRVGTRNVVMTIDLNPNPALGETISGLRELLYKTFVDPLVNADHIELVLHEDDGRVRNLYGYTEKFETEIFDIETLAQISMICPDPYIRDLEETVLTNPSGTWVSVPFTYTGTAEAGFVAQINISANTPVLNIKNNGQVMTITHSFLAGDIVHVNTKRGERDITYVRGGTTYPLIASLSSSSKWLELHSQVNTMNVYGTLPTDLIAGVKTLTYRAAYWGV
jgi:hypothetical protein